jgi:hypothetical protein
MPSVPGFPEIGDVDADDAMFLTQGLNGRIGINLFTPPEETDQRIRRNLRPPFVQDDDDADDDYD